MPQADWYFDFISPYAYFASLRLSELDGDCELACKPVLFAGLLKHWGQKGPAEIPGKRAWTYRSCLWYARRHAVAFTAPAAHPFNPLPYLRLAVAAGCTRQAIDTIFAEIWTTGCDPADPELLARLAARLEIDPARVGDREVKSAVRANTDEAIARGVFGVPTLLINGEVFWGVDGMDFARDYLDDPAVLDDPEMRRVTFLPTGASRRSND